MKKLTGILGVILGLAGLVASVGALAGVWYIRGSATERATNVVDSGNQLLQTVAKRLEKVDSILKSGQSKLQQVQTVTKKVADLGDESDPEDRKKLETITTSLANGFSKTESLLEVLHVGAATVHNGFELTRSLPMASSAESLIDHDILSKLKSAAEEVDATSDKLKELQTRVAKIRDSNDTKKNAASIVTLAVGLRTKLTSLENRVGDIQQSLVTTQEKLPSLKSDLSFWSLAIAVAFTLILVWAGLGQWCLLQRGFAMTRSDSVS